MEMLIKNLNFGQKTKLWSKIEILLKNRNFAQKSKFCSKIEILVKKSVTPRSDRNRGPTETEVRP